MTTILAASAELPTFCTSSLCLWGGLVAGGLMLFAVAVFFHTLGIGHVRRPTFGQTLAWAGSFLWALPVLAVGALVVARAAPRFEDPVIPAAEVPSAIQVDIEDPEGLKLEADDPADSAAPKNDTKRSRIGRTVRSVVSKVGSVVAGRKPEIESTSPIPEWILAPDREEHGRTRIVLVSDEQPTLAEAEEDVRQQASARVRGDFERRNPTRIDWTVPAAAIRFDEKNQYAEEIQRKADNVRFTMHRVYRQLVIDDETRAAAANAWRGEVVVQRLRGLGGVLGMAVLVIAASALYLRLDNRTQGTRRIRLKAATTAAITAGGLVLAALV